MKTYTLEELTDNYIGKKGTPKREKFEFELKTDIIGEIIRQTRKEQHLTQEELVRLIGVQKAQISKIESNAKDVRFSTILRVFEALKTKVKLCLEFETKRELYSFLTDLRKQNWLERVIPEGTVAKFSQTSSASV